MPRFAANISMLFTELPLLERIGAARRAGFAAVECQFPYDHEPEAVRAALDAAGLPMVLHNLPGGNTAAGERGLACLSGRVAEFRQGLATARHYAQVLGVKTLNCLAGILPPGADRLQARAVLIDNLTLAAGMMADAGITLVIEPLNNRDTPGFFLPTAADALALLAAMPGTGVKLQFDLYHGAVMAEDLAAILAASMPQIGHIQIADHPGRHEPGTGVIALMPLLEKIDALGYQGWVGCEYNPLSTTLAGLGWMSATR
ncbi:MAG: TIM barrel protein [Hyphomicrobiales bacterium]|nr:TIM barrel protein [Hyphomicrobiales bacterium]